MQLSLYTLLLAMPFSMPKFAFATSVDFLQHPKSLNVTLGSTAEFQCRIVSSSLYWRTNITTQLKSRGFTERGGITTSILSVPAIEDNNNTKMECVTGIGDEEFFSTPAYLKVQGPLNAPSNIEVFPLQKQIHISWNPPFTLDITNTENDLWYTIEIMNITNSNEPISIPCATCPLYEPHYNFTVDIPDPCTHFIFQITAINGAGNGKTSQLVHGYFLRVPESIMSTDIETVVILHPQGMLELKFLLPFSSCSGDSVIPYQLKVHFEDGDDSQYVFDRETEVQALGDNGSISVTLIVCNRTLPFQKTYRVTLEAQNEAGQTTYLSESIKLYTYPSPNFDRAEVIVSENGSLCITCVYTPGSEVLGCVAILQVKNGTPMMYNVSRMYMGTSAHGCFTFQNEDDYTVSVYTWESDSNGYIGRYPVYIAQFSPSSTTPVTAISMVYPQPSSIADDQLPHDSMCPLSCIVGVAAGFSIIVTCVATLACFGIIRSQGCHRNTISSKNPEGVEISLKQNISYEQQRLSGRNYPPEPKRLEQCPAYGVVAARQ